MKVLYFRYINVSAVSLANNHLLDYGKKGVKTTIETLSANNILYSGITLTNKENATQV